jgi:hypothetical protein
VLDRSNWQLGEAQMRMLFLKTPAKSGGRKKEDISYPCSVPQSVMSVGIGVVVCTKCVGSRFEELCRKMKCICDAPPIKEICRCWAASGVLEQLASAINDALSLAYRQVLSRASSESTTSETDGRRWNMSCVLRHKID